MFLWFSKNVNQRTFMKNIFTNFLMIIGVAILWTVAGCTINVIQSQSDNGAQDSVEDSVSPQINPEVTIPFKFGKQIGV